MIFKRSSFGIVHLSLYIWIAFGVFSVTGVNCKVAKRDVMDNINNGLKYAGQMLGINTASDVANLVAKAFNQNSATKKQDSTPLLSSSSSSSQNSFDPATLFNGILRVMGFDGSKIGAMAVNGIIFIAQMLGNALTNTFRPQTPEYLDRLKEEHQPRFEGAEKNSGRTARSGSPLDWMLSNPSEELTKLLVDIRDRKLPENLALAINGIQQNEGESDCIQLLLCKSAPFVWGMQKSISKRLDAKYDATDDVSDHGVEENRIDMFFKHLPNVEEYKQHGQHCENRYSNCNTSGLNKS